ncbi:thiolase family protein [Patulibacter minatonensis]|uniref:thiolase family protein n=1 Tax=Patulibacter minatonensis TaxID=298163 RepID=UPI00047AD085|nr:thiolase family protein [Patulibacter minatonensis]
MTDPVGVISTFQTRFGSRHPDVTYVEQAQQAAVGALHAAGMRPDDIDAVVYCMAPTFFMGVSDADQWAVDHVFAAGKPFFRIHTGGSTGGSAVHAALGLLRSRMFRSVLVVGAERLNETADAQEILNLTFDAFYERDMPLSTNTSVALMASRYLQRHGLTERDLARAPVRQRRSALKNPYAHLKGEITVDDVLESPLIAHPLKLYDVCPRSSGSAAMILGDAETIDAFQPRPAFINGFSSVSDTYWLGDRLSDEADLDLGEMEIAAVTARECFGRAGITDPFGEIQVAELYDPYSLIGYLQLEQLGFCAGGEAPRLDAEGTWDLHGGGVAVNPSGGTLCTNPIAITGLVRAIEAANQVMGTAGELQATGVRNTIATAIGGMAQFTNVTLFGDDHRDTQEPTR